ncbi:MAG TPA: hypothetical protein VFQ61_22955, partial [Polyangiaceae bacterium]|nr:hypothetical protein [Polyangiaceae bacterium]
MSNLADRGRRLGAQGLRSYLTRAASSSREVLSNAVGQLRTGKGVRALGLTCVLLIAAGFFLGFVDRSYPIREWLFFRYAGYWAVVLVWGAGSFGVGYGLLTRVFRVRFGLLTEALLSFTLGQLAFEYLLFLVGLCQGYRAFAFYLVPLAFLALGGGGLLALLRRTQRILARPAPPRSLLRFATLAFGCAALGMIYFLILTPDNVQFDARWKHMALAEDYAAHGGIHRSPEGWMFAARPHITSYLYAWAFLIPSGRLFDQMLLGAHLEYFAFLVSTVLGIPALVRRLVPRADPAVVWAARFLFPGVLLYDSSLSGGTDHFGALYAIPIAIVLLRSWRDFTARTLSLLATLLAGPVLVKETAALLLVPFPLLVVGTRFVTDLWQRLRTRSASDGPSATLSPARPFWLAPLVAIGTGLLVTTPLWLKNLVWYGDPLYPSLHRFFPSHPWSEAAAYKLKWAYSERQMWAPKHDLQGLIATLKALFTYSFVPNNWKALHRDVPV